MTKIRAVVIDDEIKSREVIKSLLEHFCPEVEVVGEAGDIAESIEVITQQSPDLVFLDITLKEGDSFQILQELKKIDFEIIFVTAYDEYSVKALNFSGITCLFKPLDIEELQQAVKQVSRRSTDMGLAYEMVNGMLKSRFTRLPIITTSGLSFTDVAEITYIIQREKGVRIHFRNGKHVESERNIHEFADVIFNDRFSSIGSRLLVNTIHLKSDYLKQDQLLFRNDTAVTLHRDEFKRAKAMVN
jgi:two-component system, LytTR family, response regulator